MSVAETNLSRYSAGIIETQTTMDGLQTAHENAILANDTATASRLQGQIRRETSKMKRYESYTKFWEAALEIMFYLIGIATTILRIRIT